MKKTSSPFLFYAAVAVCGLGVLFLTSLIMIRSGTTKTIRASLARPGLSPKLSPEYVALLKEQAEAKKILNGEQSKERKELKDRQLTEKNTLLQKHRTEREKFLTEKHSADERKDFFTAQRNEMAELKKRHREEAMTLSALLETKMRDLLENQKKARIETVNVDAKKPEEVKPAETHSESSAQ